MNYQTNPSGWTGDDAPPPGWKRYREAAWLAARMWNGVGHLGPRGPVDGPPALVIPGFLANDRTAMELRRSLARDGWRVHGWGMGLNRGAKADTLHRLRERLDEIWDGRPILVVGWSLGGLFARELAREEPNRVRAVVTLGSPFSGSPRQNNVWRLYEWVAGHSVDDPPVPHSADKPPVPTLALWSSEDGLIAIRAARGLPNERDAIAEIRCCHMAFGVSGKITRQVAREIRKFLDETEC
jgi:pimeloyl-ACP methyl ester carboxylesterase